MTLTVGSLFSGIGGLELGLEWAGMETRWQVENDPFCQRVLEQHWPHVTRYTDIHDVDPDLLEPVDVICGGFPCQPVSLAGKREAQNDPRWLWPEFFRIVRVLRPSYVLVENVPGLASAGMGDVLGDLASIGYDAEWESIPAAAVGAPHLRYRIFIVAYPDSQSSVSRNINHLGTGSETGSNEKPLRRVVRRTDSHENVSDSSSEPARVQHGKPPASRQKRGSGDRLESTLVRPGDGTAHAEGSRADSPTVADPDSERTTVEGRTGQTVPRPETEQRPERRSGRSGEGNVADPENKRLETDGGHVGRLGGPRGQETEPGSVSPQSRTEQLADPEREGLERHRPQRGLEESSRQVETGRRSQLSDPDQLRRNRRPRIFREGGWPQLENFRLRTTNWKFDPADDPESGVGRVANGIPNRVDRIKTLGNAVVPQVAQWVGMQIIREQVLAENRFRGAANGNAGA